MKKWLVLVPGYLQQIIEAKTWVAREGVLMFLDEEDRPVYNYGLGVGLQWREAREDELAEA